MGTITAETQREGNGTGDPETQRTKGEKRDERKSGDDEQEAQRHRGGRETFV